MGHEFVSSSYNTPIPTELIDPLLPSMAFIFVMSVCFEVFLVSQLSEKPVLSLHPTSQTRIASKPGLKQFPGGSRIVFV